MQGLMQGPCVAAASQLIPEFTCLSPDPPTPGLSHAPRVSISSICRRDERVRRSNAMPE